MVSVFERWASLGVLVDGPINPFEDPEKLLSESLEMMGEIGRMPGIIASWLARYGHLLLTRKLKYKSPRGRRLFSALIEESGTQEKKLLNLVQKPSRSSPVFLSKNLVPVLEERIRKDPNPRFLKHGFLIKNTPLVRSKIIRTPIGTFKRSIILRNRALYGASLRSDLLSTLPKVKELSLRELARRLNVAPPVVHHILSDYTRSGLVEWTGTGRSSRVRWCGVVSSESKVA